jgi:hypothetical protein
MLDNKLKAMSDLERSVSKHAVEKAAELLEHATHDLRDPSSDPHAVERSLQTIESARGLLLPVLHKFFADD